jgi:hypothetical protein
MVIESDGKRLAVECDGDRYRTPESLGEDIARQAVLERLGWEFVRIRGSAFYRDPDAALRRVFDRLEELRIEPVVSAEVSVASVEEKTPAKSLVEELEELMGRPVASPTAPVAVEGDATEAEPKKTPKPRRRFGRQP